MCNACGNMCCGSDQFEACGCDGCFEPECHSRCDMCDEQDCDGDCQDWDEVEDAEVEFRLITAEPDDPYDTARDTRRDDRDIHGI